MPGPTHHVVLLRFRAGATAEEIENVGTAIRGLAGAIAGVEDVRWGAGSSPEGLEHGYTHGFVMRFRDDAARDAYLPHPLHRPVAETIGRLCEDVLVFDISS